MWKISKWITKKSPICWPISQYRPFSVDIVISPIVDQYRIIVIFVIIVKKIDQSRNIVSPWRGLIKRWITWNLNHIILDVIRANQSPNAVEQGSETNSFGGSVALHGNVVVVGVNKQYISVYEKEEGMWAGWKERGRLVTDGRVGDIVRMYGTIVLSSIGDAKGLLLPCTSIIM